MAAESGGGEGKKWKCPNPDCGKVLPGPMPGMSYCPDCKSPCRPSAAEAPPIADDSAEENRNNTSGEGSDYSSQNAEIGSRQNESGGGTLDQSLSTTAIEGEPADQQISPAAPVGQRLQKVEQSGALCTETNPSLNWASAALSKTGDEKKETEFETAVEETGGTTRPKDDGKHEDKESSEQKEGSDVYYDARSNNTSSGNDKQVEVISQKLEAKQEKQKSESQKDKYRKREAAREKMVEERKEENLRRQEARGKKEKEEAEKWKQELQEREKQKKKKEKSTGVVKRATTTNHPLSRDENENKSKNGADKETASRSGIATRGAAGESKTGTSENKGGSSGESSLVSFMFILFVLLQCIIYVPLLCMPLQLCTLWSLNHF